MFIYSRLRDFSTRTGVSAAAAAAAAPAVVLRSLTDIMCLWSTGTDSRSENTTRHAAQCIAKTLCIEMQSKLPRAVPFLWSIWCGPHDLHSAADALSACLPLSLSRSATSNAPCLSLSTICRLANRVLNKQSFSGDQWRCEQWPIWWHSAVEVRQIDIGFACMHMAGRQAGSGATCRPIDDAVCRRRCVSGSFSSSETRRVQTENCCCCRPSTTPTSGHGAN